MQPYPPVLHATKRRSQDAKATCYVRRACNALLLESIPFPGIAGRRKQVFLGMLLAKPVLLATHSLGMRLPLAENALLQAACLIPALLSSSRTCTELSGAAGDDSTALTDVAQASRPPSVVALSCRLCSLRSARYATTEQ